MDIEKPIRADVKKILEPFFTCFEEVAVHTSSDDLRRSDLLAVSNLDSSIPIVLGIEVKSHPNTSPGKFKEALVQASKYVGAVVVDKRYSRISGKSIDAAIVYPAPDYHGYGSVSENDGREYFLTGMVFLAEALNVGMLVQRKLDWEIRFGPNDLWSRNKGWMGHAKDRFPSKGTATAFDKECMENGPFDSLD